MLKLMFGNNDDHKDDGSKSKYILLKAPSLTKILYVLLPKFPDLYTQGCLTNIKIALTKISVRYCIYMCAALPDPDINLAILYAIHCVNMLHFDLGLDDRRLIS